MANRMDQREGRQTTSAQRLGRAADALHNALVQSVGAGPAADPVIRVFPACPHEWDAAFTLLCRGGFLVTIAAPRRPGGVHRHRVATRRRVPGAEPVGR